MSLNYINFPPDLELWLTLSGLSYSLEQIFMVAKMFVLLRFNCICKGKLLLTSTSIRQACLLRGMDTLSVKATVKCFCLPSEKGSSLKESRGRSRIISEKGSI